MGTEFEALMAAVEGESNEPQDVAAPDKAEEIGVLGFFEALPQLPLMPDESSEVFMVFREGILEDLAPQTAYAEVIADNVIANEWELYRLRKWRQKLLLARAMELLVQALKKASLDIKTSDARTLAQSALQKGEGQAGALKILKDLDIDISTSIALSYTALDGPVVYIDDQIASYEVRRRRLRQDFNAINDRVIDVITDAELV